MRLIISVSLLVLSFSLQLAARADGILCKSLHPRLELKLYERKVGEGWYILEQRGFAAGQREKVNSDEDDLSCNIDGLVVRCESQSDRPPFTLSYSLISEVQITSLEQERATRRPEYVRVEMRKFHETPKVYQFELEGCEEIEDKPLPRTVRR